MIGSANSNVGSLSGSNGTVTVSGVNANGTPSRWTVSTNLVVANAGVGQLNVQDGGRVTAGQAAFIGFSAGSVGAVTVSGSGSTWKQNSPARWLVVGRAGQGRLTIDQGGAVSVAGYARVGEFGAARGDVLISSGGTLSVQGHAQLGTESSTQGVVHVSGAGSEWRNTGGLTIGLHGKGEVTIADDAMVSVAGPTVLASGASGTGTINIGAAADQPAAAPGTLNTPSLAFGAGAGTLNFNHTHTGHDFGVAMSGGGLANSTINHLAGVTNLTGDSSAFRGTINVTGGTLRVNGTLGDAGSIVNVSNSAVLGGGGTIGGSVSIGNGVLSPGNNPGTLTIAGNLALSSSSTLNWDLGQANTAGGALNDLVNVGGNLTLDGTLNVTPSVGGQYGAGVYLLFNYGGTLTDNGLQLGGMPAGTDNYIQTSIAHQVNLVNNLVGSQGLALNWWDGDAGGRNDGAIAGGSGTWVAAAPHGTDNWTTANGTVNAPYQDAAFAIFAGAPGTVTVDNGQGAVRVSGMQFVTSGYRIEGGSVTLMPGTNAIRVGDGTMTGAATMATIDSELAGSGGLDKVDEGTLVLTAANSYSGGTTVTGGTLIGSATSFGGGLIVNNAALVIDQASDAGMANSIHGTGRLVKTGAGTLDYTGIGNLSGPTTVAGGTLAVNGALAHSAFTVASGATLAGTGTVGATTLQSGGIVSPGSSNIGTLTVNGNFSQAAGSLYQVQVDPASSASDGIQVVGSANVDGATLQVARLGTGNFRLGTRYTVLSADGGVSGAYRLAGDTHTAFVQLFDRYDAHNVYLSAEKARNFASAGLTPNQIATAGGLDTLALTSPLVSAIAWLPNDVAARDAFDQLSGEFHASTKSANLEDSRFARDAAIERLRDAFCAPGSAAMTTDRKPQAQDPQQINGGCTPDDEAHVAWGQVFGSWGRIDGNGNAAKLSRDIGGFFVGADTGVGDGWRLGGMAGHSRTSADVDARNSSSRTDSYHLGIYGGKQWGATALRLGASHSWNRTETRRHVSFAGFADNLSAKYDGTTTQVFGEVGHRFDVANVALEPFGRLAHISLRTNDYAERGEFSALYAQRSSTNVTLSTLGLRASTRLGESTRLRGMGGWRHAFGDTTPASTHAFTGSVPFSISGVPMARDLAVIETGFETQLKPDLTLGASYVGQFGGGLSDNGFKVSLKWEF